MEITYTRQGDYYLPNLTLPEQPQVELGMYAQHTLSYFRPKQKRLPHINAAASAAERSKITSWR